MIVVWLVRGVARGFGGGEGGGNAELFEYFLAPLVLCLAIPCSCGGSAEIDRTPHQCRFPDKGPPQGLTCAYLAELSDFLEVPTAERYTYVGSRRYMSLAEEGEMR